MEVLNEGKKKFNFDDKDDKKKKKEVSDKDQDDDDDDDQDDGEKVSSRAKGRKRVMDEAKTFIEDTEINELSKKTLGSYINKSSNDAAHLRGLKRKDFVSGKAGDKGYDKSKNKEWNRKSGISTAVGKLTKEETVKESYKEVQDLYIDKLVDIRDELHSLLGKLIGEHEAAESAQKKITAMHQAGKKPNESLYKKTHGRIYDAKYLLRELETARDAVLSKCQPVKESMENAVEAPVETVAESKQTDGAYPPEPFDSKWSKGTKRFVKGHVIKFDVDGEDAANKTAASIRNSMTKGKARPGDNTNQMSVDAPKT